MKENFVKFYDASQYLSVDESMILFKGRSSIKQYKPKKPIKRAYKLWMIAHTDGCINKFDVYQGKFEHVPEDMKPFGLGERFVLSMVDHLHNKNHEVYLYNYFTSISLLEHLKNVGVRACGTIKANRKFLPTHLKQHKTMQRGDFDYRVASDIVFYNWMDNKPVPVVSNFHGTDTAKVSRKLRDGSKKEFDCPLAVKKYNMYMGGVDLADFRCAVNGRSRKSPKSWHRIFFELLDRTLANSFVVFKKLTHENMIMLTYRRHVVQSLVTHAKPPKVGRPISNTTFLDSQSVPKRHKSNYSVNKSIRLENLGVSLGDIC